MSEAPIWQPADGAMDVSASRANILAAIDLLGDAQVQLRTAFPTVWRGTGANTFTTAVLGLLHHAQGVDRALRTADHTVARMDAELAAWKVTGTV
jgi:uncharacterized protein YukE